MIGFVDKRPTIEPHGGCFLVTLSSGDTAAPFMLTRHAFASFLGIGALRLKEAEAREAVFEPTPLRRKPRGSK